MNLLAETRLKGVDWKALGTIDGTAEHVPTALRRLAEAETAEAARAAYWQRDNRVVVQAQLFEAAVPVVPVLLALLVGPLSGPARRRVVELLLQIGCGAPHQREVERGRADLADRCRQFLLDGLWTIYGLLLDPEARVREAAIELLECIDPNREQLGAILSAVAADDVSDDVRAFALRILVERRVRASRTGQLRG